MKKKKYKNTYSTIIAGFINTMTIGGTSSVKGTVFLGGPYYAIYVNDGHMLRDGAWWEGYHFIEAGAKEGEKVFRKYVNEELRNIGKR